MVARNSVSIGIRWQRMLIISLAFAMLSGFIACNSIGTITPTETSTTSAIPASTETSTPTITPSPVPPNPFVGYWVLTEIPATPASVIICGNFQSVEFFEDRAFIVQDQYHGMYEILDERHIGIKYNSNEDSGDIWNYVITDDTLAMSIEYPNLPGGMTTCNLIRMDK